MEKNKPPLGVRPRAIHDQGRLSDLFNAVLRYMTDGRKIPEAWREEIDDLLFRYQEDESE